MKLYVRTPRKSIIPVKGEKAMLTSEQSIVEYKNGLAIPDRLSQSAHHHYLIYAEKMLAIYRDGRGKKRRDLHRQVEKLFEGEWECPSRRIQSFCKLLDEKSEYNTDPYGKAGKLRMEVFSQAAKYQPLVTEPDQLFDNSESQVKEMIARKLGMSWSEISGSLYMDVKQFQTLKEFEGYLGPAAFLSRYNIAQLQASLYRAQKIIVTASDDFKIIMRYANLAGLLHEVTLLKPGQYQIIFSGPASILRQTRRYGVNFAKFLPALLACRGWRMEAYLQSPWNKSYRLDLSAADGFRSHLPEPEEFDSSVEESLATKFGEVQDGWRLIREGAILHERQKTFVPDFVFRREDGTQALLEIVGFWTPEYLESRRRTLSSFKRHNILIAVPEKSLREGAKIGDNVLVYKTTIKLSALMEKLEKFRTDSGSRAE